MSITGVTSKSKNGNQGLMPSMIASTESLSMTAICLPPFHHRGIIGFELEWRGPAGEELRRTLLRLLGDVVARRVER
jgi:hypothetical protein